MQLSYLSLTWIIAPEMKKRPLKQLALNLSFYKKSSFKTSHAVSILILLYNYIQLYRPVKT